MVFIILDLVDNMDLKWKIIKMGRIIREYIIKYIIVYSGFIMYSSPIIHPMWVIDE
jgi:hypothetical protein